MTRGGLNLTKRTKNPMVFPEYLRTYYTIVCPFVNFGDTKFSSETTLGRFKTPRIFNDDKRFITFVIL
jgi:hypothetical protein